jgi:hypothetical protein
VDVTPPPAPQSISLTPAVVAWPTVTAAPISRPRGLSRTLSLAGVGGTVVALIGLRFCAAGSSGPSSVVVEAESSTPGTSFGAAVGATLGIEGGAACDPSNPGCARASVDFPVRHCDLQPSDGVTRGWARAHQKDDRDPICGYYIEILQHRIDAVWRNYVRGLPRSITCPPARVMSYVGKNDGTADGIFFQAEPNAKPYGWDDLRSLGVGKMLRGKDGGENEYVCFYSKPVSGGAPIFGE